MQQETIGKVISAKEQWWCKINRKPVRSSAADGAVFPCIIKVEYSVNGQTYVKRKWLGTNEPVPAVGTALKVVYEEGRPGKILELR